MIGYAQRVTKLFIGKIIPTLSLAVIYITFSHQLSPESYGLYQTVWVILSFSTIISCFGIPSTIIALMSKCSQDTFHIFLKKGLQLSLALAVGCYIFVIFYYNQFSLLEKALLFPLIITQSYYLIQEAQIIASNREDKLLMLNGIYATLLLILHLGILYLCFNLTQLIIGITLLSAFRSFLTKKHIFSQALFPANNSISEKELNELRLFSGANESVSILSKWIDKIVMAGIMKASDFAIYFNGAIEIPFFNILLGSAQSIMASEIGKQYETQDQSAIEMFKSSALLVSSLVFPIVLFLFFNKLLLFEILFGNKYLASTEIFTITLWVLPIRIISFTGMLQALNQGKKLLIGGIFDLMLTFLLMWPLYQLLGSKGVALSMVLATYCQACYYLHSITKHLHLSFFQGLPFIALIKRLLISTLVLLPVYLLCPDNIPFLEIGISGLATISLILWFISQQISLAELLKSIVKRP